MYVSSGSAPTGQQEPKELRPWKCWGRGTVLETLGASQAQPPTPPAGKDAAFQEAEAAKHSWQMPRLTLCVLLAGTGRGWLEQEGGGGACGLTQLLGQWDIPALSLPTAPRPVHTAYRAGGEPWADFTEQLVRACWSAARSSLLQCPFHFLLPLGQAHVVSQGWGNQEGRGGWRLLGDLAGSAGPPED